MREIIEFSLFDNVRLMQFRRAVALGTLVLGTAACSGGVAIAPTTGNPVPTTTGEVCGVTAIAGGPATIVGVKHRALLHVCPSGPPVAVTRYDGFTLMASNGRRYEAYRYKLGAWSARLPAGTYRAVGAFGCSGADRPFVVAAGKTLKGVIIWFGCDWN